MSFLEKVKCWFNIGGIELMFKIDHNIQKQSGEIKGKLVVTSQGERHVKKIHLVLEQRHDINRGGTHTVKFIQIGEMDLNEDMMMKAGDSKTIDFTLSFDAQKTLTDKVADKLMDQGGLLSVAGAVGSFISNVQTQYFLKAKAEVEGTLMSPDTATQVKLL